MASFTDLFNKVYTRYLAVSAKDVYFIETVNDLVVDLDLYEDRIFVTYVLNRSSKCLLLTS